MTEKAIKDRLLCFPFSLSLSYMFVPPRCLANPHPRRRRPRPRRISVISGFHIVDRQPVREEPGVASEEPWNLEPNQSRLWKRDRVLSATRGQRGA